jgi:succinate dehydrogenase / fumarate reductase, cytochrome b subunit
MTDAVKPHPRPLSPHLQVYRLPMTANMSITHRLSGVILAGGCLLVTAFFIAAAMGPEYYHMIKEFAATPWGLAIIGAWSLVLYYHLCNGIRHLFWDMGALFEKKEACVSGWLVILATLVLTGSTWYCALMF